MHGLVIMHWMLWRLCWVLCYLTVASWIWFILTANEPTWKAFKFFGAGAITLAFLATWL